MNAPETSAPPSVVPAGRHVLRPVVRDVLLLLAGVVLAVAADQWREARAERRRVSMAIASIRVELIDNLARVDSARAHHLLMADTLGAYLRRRESPPERVYFGGMLQPASVLSTAWQTARETGALSELPYDLVLRLAPVYETQETYRALGESLAHGVMLEVPRRGAMAVFRDGFANFILIEQDFANREAVLARRYRNAVATLDSIDFDGRRRESDQN
jgi:hypothetical protein